MYNGIEDVPLAALGSARVRQFDAYWRQHLRGATIPRRDDIELADILRLLPYMFVAEIEPEPFRVRYRLAGTNTAQMNGIDVTGYYLDRLQGDQGDWARDGVAFYRRAWEQQRPVYGAYNWPTEHGANCRVEFGLFPVTLRTGEVQIFAVEEWHLSGAGAAIDRPLPIYPKATEDQENG